MSTTITKDKLNPVGVRKSSGLISIIAAATNTTLYQITTGRVSTAIIKKIFIANRTAGNVQVTIGIASGANLTQKIPSILVITGNDTQLDESMIPCEEFTADIVVRSSGAGATPADVQIEIEVEEVR